MDTFNKRKTFGCNLKLIKVTLSVMAYFPERVKTMLDPIYIC